MFRGEVFHGSGFGVYGLVVGFKAQDSRSRSSIFTGL